MPLSAAFQRDDHTPDEAGRDSDWSLWIPASRTFNFCNDEPLIDWLDLYGQANGFIRDDQRPGLDPRTDFRQFLLERAEEFENAACSYLAARHELIRIRQRPEDARSRAAVELTWDAMCRGVEIIAQAVLWNPQTRMYGAPDLLIRSDVLHQLFPSELMVPVSAPDLPIGDRHYRVVDIKFTTLNLRQDGGAGSEHLKYMVQLWIYNDALGRMQGYTPSASYLLGRRWLTARGRGANAMERLARVSHDYYLRSVGMTLATYASAACDWGRRVRSQGAHWSVLPVPVVKELWPNMRSSNDQPWHHAKLEIARALEDLTLLPRVTCDKRTRAHAGGIVRWTDPACCSANLQITGEKNPAIVDAVIQANQSGANGPIVFPDRVTANEALWRNPVIPEFFVDFETVSDLDDDFSHFPEAGGQPLIFMIGCGHVLQGADGPRWTFSSFTADSIGLEEERRIIDEWLAHMRRVCGECGVAVADARIFHWSPAETSYLTEAYNAAHVRQGNPDWPDLPWCDLLNRVIKEQPVTVRGAFGFGLKAIAKALHAHRLIETVWGDGPIDGLGAMVGAWWCHREATRLVVSMTELDLMQEITRYNEIDCKVMAETLDYLRLHR